MNYTNFLSDDAIETIVDRHWNNYCDITSNVINIHKYLIDLNEEVEKARKSKVLRLNLSGGLTLIPPATRKPKSKEWNIEVS